MNLRNGALVCAALISAVPIASAQGSPRVEVEVEAATRLAEVRESLRIERREAGITLLTMGAASLLGGGAIAAAGHESELWLSLGLGTIAWGAVNAGLALPLLDIGDGRAGEIRRDRASRGRELARVREDALRAQHNAATLFALNLGLDVFYIGTGSLLFFVADQLDTASDADLMRGYSIAQIIQGGLLLVFDLVQWIASIARADRVAASFHPMPPR